MILNMEYSAKVILIFGETNETDYIVNRLLCYKENFMCHNTVIKKKNDIVLPKFSSQIIPFRINISGFLTVICFYKLLIKCMKNKTKSFVCVFNASL